MAMDEFDSKVSEELLDALLEADFSVARFVLDCSVSSVAVSSLALPFNCGAIITLSSRVRLARALA